MWYRCIRCKDQSKVVKPNKIAEIFHSLLLLFVCLFVENKVFTVFLLFFYVRIRWFSAGADERRKRESLQKGKLLQDAVQTSKNSLHSGKFFVLDFCMETAILHELRSSVSSVCVPSLFRCAVFIVSSLNFQKVLGQRIIHDTTTVKYFQQLSQGLKKTREDLGHVLPKISLLKMDKGIRYLQNTSGKRGQSGSSDWCLEYSHTESGEWTLFLRSTRTRDLVKGSKIPMVSKIQKYSSGQMTVAMMESA